MKMIIVPQGSGIVALLKRAVRARKTHYNYMITWRDVNGTGISLAVAPWLEGNQTYVN